MLLLLLLCLMLCYMKWLVSTMVAWQACVPYSWTHKRSKQQYRLIVLVCAPCAVWHSWLERRPVRYWCL